MADASVWTDAAAGPASYSTGGFTIATGLSTVAGAKVEVQTPGANLGQVCFDITLAGASFTVKVMRENFDRQTTIDGVIGLPASVTLRTASGGTYDVVSHTHNIDHDHAAVTSTGAIGAAGGVVTGIAAPNISTHTHSFDVPSLSGVPSGAEAAHAQTWDSLYQHSASLTNTQTDLAATELAAATDLSGTTFIFKAVSA